MGWIYVSGPSALNIQEGRALQQEQARIALHKDGRPIVKMAQSENDTLQKN